MFCPHLQSSIELRDVSQSSRCHTMSLRLIADLIASPAPPRNGPHRRPSSGRILVCSHISETRYRPSLSEFHKQSFQRRSFAMDRHESDSVHVSSTNLSRRTALRGLGGLAAVLAVAGAA